MKGKMKDNPTFFDEKGSQNTKKCFELVSKRLEDLDVDYVVVASTSGETGVRAIEFFSDLNVEIVVVTHQYGFKEDGKIELDRQKKKNIGDAVNSSLVITPDVLTRVPKVVRGRYGGFSYLDLIADTLRMFSEGVKVCVECIVQASDSGKIPVGEEVVAIAGTGSGADTAVVLESQHSHKLLDMDIREIICMPRER